MSQRNSGYERLKAYETPAWVTHTLLPHIPDRVKIVWEPACASGKMVRALEGFTVRCSDITGGHDFLAPNPCPDEFDAIITNPLSLVSTAG